MAENLFIQHAPWETRVALAAAGRVVELEVERTTGRTLSGNIYRGRVHSIVPDLNAAFVDIGLERMALLHASEVWRGGAASDEGTSTGGAIKGAPPSRTPKRPIGALLEPGAEIMVQVVREPAAKKGPRATMHVTLPGRNIVFLPCESHIGVSRRVADPAERRRLHRVLSDALEEGTGAIVRTLGEGATEEELRADLAFLQEAWRDIRARHVHASAPSFLYTDLDLVLRSLRDLVGPDTETVWIDDPSDRDRVETFLGRFHPHHRPQVRLHEGPTGLFTAHGLDRWVREATSPTVSLKSGGQLVFSRTEAMTVVDVNSSRQVARRGMDDALLLLNLEAAREIALQLRLRNIGGLIVVDFVDMRRAEDRKMLAAVFEIELGIDRSRVRMGRLSPFGLVELTRKRARESVYDRLTETCPTCHGTGYVRSSSDLAIETVERLQRALRATEATGLLLHVRVPARVAAILKGQLAGVIEDLAAPHGARVEISVAAGAGDPRVQVVDDGGAG